MSTPTYERASYEIASLESQLSSIRGRHLTKTSEQLRDEWLRAQTDELRGMRSIHDKQGKPNFWSSEGTRTITDAREKEYRLALFREALARTDIAYVRAGRDLMPDSWLIYCRDTTSPTGVVYLMNFDFCPESNALVEASRRTTVSPTEGLRMNERL